MTDLPVRLFLVTPPVTKARVDAVAACLSAACAAGDVACVLVSGAKDEDSPDEIPARAVVETAHAHDAAVVVRDSVAVMRAIGADGVHVTRGPREVRDARRTLGAEGIVGATAERGRHEAMELGEAGIDYIAIDQRLAAGGENLLAWWAEMFVIPVVAMHPASIDEIPALARAGADFVRPDEAMWNDPETAAAIIAETMHALREVAA